jgi:ATP-dependent helicase/DNAse subunit B
LFEEPFRLELGEGTVVNGRIDRLEIDEGSNALIFDYKYRRAARLRDTVAENESGERVQTGVYLLGAKELNYNPIGMAYCGFKKEVSVLGWVIEPFHPELNAACSKEQLNEVMGKARETAMRASSDIRSGRIAPEPADVERCQFCDFVAICRYEVREAPRAAAGGTGAA